MLKAPTLSKSQMNIGNFSDLNEHKASHQERWGIFSDGHNVGQFNCERGYSTHKEFKSTTSNSTDSGSSNPWCLIHETSVHAEEHPFKTSFNVGKEYYTNSEILFEKSRYWSKFKGFSFESFNSYASSNTMYLRRVATCWINAEGNTLRCASYLDGSSRSTSGEYYYWRQNWREGDFDELNLQREGYFLNGFAFNFRSKGGTGGSSWKDVQIFNLRLHTSNEDMPDGVRVVLPAMQKVRDPIKPLGYGDVK